MSIINDMYQNGWFGGETVENTNKAVDGQLFNYLWQNLVYPLLQHPQIKIAWQHLGNIVVILIVCYMSALLMDMMERKHISKAIKFTGLILALKSLFTI